MDFNFEQSEKKCLFDIRQFNLSDMKKAAEEVDQGSPLKTEELFEEFESHYTVKFEVEQDEPKEEKEVTGENNCFEI